MRTAFSSLKEFIDRFGESAQGRILLGGAVYAVCFLAFVFYWSWHSGESGKMAGMFLSFLATGAAGGVVVGTEQELPGVVVFLTAFSMEMIVTLFFYPLATFSSEEVARLPWVRRRIKTSMKTAERWREPLRRWGAIGVLFFIWLPLYLTGPLVGALVARLIGYSHTVSIALSTVGTAGTVLFWMWGAQWLIDQLGPRSWILVVAVFAAAAIALAIYLAKRALRRRREKQALEGDPR